jgi:hypothetical protein
VAPRERLRELQLSVQFSSVQYSIFSFSSSSFFFSFTKTSFIMVLTMTVKELKDRCNNFLPLLETMFPGRTVSTKNTTTNSTKFMDFFIPNAGDAERTVLMQVVINRSHAVYEFGDVIRQPPVGSEPSKDDVCMNVVRESPEGGSFEAVFRFLFDNHGRITKKTSYQQGYFAAYAVCAAAAAPPAAASSSSNADASTIAALRAELDTVKNFARRVYTASHTDVPATLNI